MSCLPNWLADWLCPHGRTQALPAGLRTGRGTSRDDRLVYGCLVLSCLRLFGRPNGRRTLWSAQAERFARERK